jgi:glycerol kinase
MLMRLDTMRWDAETCAAFGVPLEALPKIVSCAEDFGRIDSSIDGLGGIAITGCIGDQQSATLGQRCDVGEAKNTYGTGCFMILNTGSTVVRSKNGLLTTMAWQLGGVDKLPVYALEGSVAIGGAVVHWLRDNLGLIAKASDIEDLASGVKDAAGVSFVPAFSGLFAPRWREDARGVIVGLTQYVNKGHIARAALDAIAFQSRDVLDAMRQDIAESTSHQLITLKVDGGASANNLLMQIQSDVLGLNVVRPADVETTARGAAYAAAVGAGLMTEEDIFRGGNSSSTQDGTTEFTPTTSREERERAYARWNAAVERSFNLAETSAEQ